MLCATRRYSNRFSSKICRQRSLPRRRNVYHQMRQIDLTGLCKYKPHFQKENNIIYFFCLTSTSCNTRRVAAKDLGLSTFPYDHLVSRCHPGAYDVTCKITGKQHHLLKGVRLSPMKFDYCKRTAWWLSLVVQKYFHTSENDNAASSIPCCFLKPLKERRWYHATDNCTRRWIQIYWAKIQRASTASTLLNDELETRLFSSALC